MSSDLAPPAAGEVVVVGAITAEGVECPALRADDGALYTLTALPRKVEVGERLQVVGRPTQFSICQQGVTLRVTRLTPASPNRGGTGRDKEAEPPGPLRDP